MTDSVTCSLGCLKKWCPLLFRSINDTYLSNFFFTSIFYTPLASIFFSLFLSLYRPSESIYLLTVLYIILHRLHARENDNAVSGDNSNNSKVTVVPVDTALNNMYLWALFGTVIVGMDCSFKRFTNSHPAIKHALLVLIVFFLFTAGDASNRASLLTTWMQALLVYILFIGSTRSAWPFVAVTILLLATSQSIKQHYKYDMNTSASSVANETIDDEAEAKAKAKTRDRALRAADYITYATIGVIVVGTIHAGVTFGYEEGYSKSKSNFSWTAAMMAGITRTRTCQ